MIRLSSAIAAAIVLCTSPIAAQENPVVVELFTSQGCSSCPPADALLSELAAREDVIALALHVDYWDYIGWKDPFGNPAHADRQRAYAAHGGRRSIYTPEMIVNGETDIVGAKPMDLSKAIAAHAAVPGTVALNVARSGDMLQIAAEPTAAVKGPMKVHLVRYAPQRTTQIKRGENAGKTIDYANVVESWTVLGSWTGEAPLKMQAAVKGDAPVVVIIQRGSAGSILAAARVR